MQSIRFSIWAILFVFLVSSCSKDQDGGSNEISESSLEMTDDVAIQISYDAEVSTFISPVSLTDKAILTKAEKAMSIPKPRGCRVNQLINSDGTIDADIEFMSFEGMSEFPNGTVGLVPIPDNLKTKKIEVRDGVSTHYSNNGEVLRTIHGGSNEAYFSEIANNLSEDMILSEEHFDLLIKGFQEANFDIEQSTGNENILYLTQSFSNNKYTKLAIHKSLQKIVGRANFDEEGNLTSSSNYVYDLDTKELLAHWFMTFYSSPFTEVDMRLSRVTKFRNFSLIKNL